MEYFSITKNQTFVHFLLHVVSGIEWFEYNFVVYIYEH